MPFHQFIGKCFTVPQAKILRLSHQTMGLLSMLPKMSAPFHHGQFDIPRACVVRSKSDFLGGSHQKLPVLPSTCSQMNMKFSSSSLCNNNRKVNDNKGKYTGSWKSSFDFFSLRSLISTPAPYMIYGLGGLIPFVSVPIYTFMTSAYCPLLAHAQLVYGACILSFLGGVAWGNEVNTPGMSDFKSLGYSVSLPLIGWMGVLTHPSVIAYPIVISGIAFAGYTDTKFQNYPQWFKNLRFLLTSLVLVSLIGTFSFSIFYPESDQKNKVKDN